MEEKNVKCNCGKNVDKFLTELLERSDNNKDNLIQILNEIQVHYGYIPDFAQYEVAKFLNMTMAEVYGVITFYSRFALKPKGKYNIAVCLGTACFVKGSELGLDRFKQKLGIEVGETTEDGLFSLEATRCVGACGLAPVFTINGKVYGNATPEMVEDIIKEYKAK